MVHEQIDAAPPVAPVYPPPSVPSLDVTPIETQLNIVLAGVQQVLSTRQQKRLQLVIRTLQMRVNALVPPPCHTETVTLDDGT